MQNPWDIRLTALSLGYGAKTILHAISAHIPAGSISLILGESGSGKSTLLRHIIGLSKPQSGSLEIAGRNLFSLPSDEFRRMRRRMGVLFQDGALLGSLRVWENVALPLSEHLSLPKTLLRAEAERVLGMVELADALDLYPNQLSGGMRKRAGLARAIIANPSLLLCDEPTSGLDPLTARRMDQLLLLLHRQFPAMTIVVVSHDLQSVERIAEYVLVVQGGGLCFTGTRDELFSSNDPYLQRFLLRDQEKDKNMPATRMNPVVAEALNTWLNR